MGRRRARSEVRDGEPRTPLSDRDEVALSAVTSFLAQVLPLDPPKGFSKRLSLEGLAADYRFRNWRQGGPKLKSSWRLLKCVAEERRDLLGRFVVSGVRRALRIRRRRGVKAGFNVGAGQSTIWKENVEDVLRWVTAIAGVELRATDVLAIGALPSLASQDVEGEYEMISLAPEMVGPWGPTSSLRIPRSHVLRGSPVDPTAPTTSKRQGPAVLRGV